MYAITTSQDHDEYLQKKVKTFRKSRFLTDCQIIGYNGSVPLHKIVLLPKLAQLEELLCVSCDLHSNTAIILPDISKDEIEKNVKALYIGGDLFGLKKLLGFNRTSNINPSLENIDSDGDITENDPKEDLERVNDKKEEVKETKIPSEILSDKFPGKIEEDIKTNGVQGADVANVLKIANFSFLNHNCHLCDSQLSSDEELSDHFFATHDPLTVETGDSKPWYQCRACSKQFRRHPAAVKHCRVRGPAYRCQDCGISIRYSNNISRHKKRCSGQRSFFCSKCGRIIKSTVMETHILKCQGKRRKARAIKVENEEKNSNACNICEFKSAHGSSLKKHITLSHSSDRYKFKCEECNREFYSASGMRKHKSDLHSQIRFEEIKVA